MTLIEQARLITETTHKAGQEISDKDLSQTMLDFITTFDNMEASGNYLPMDRTVYNLVQQAIDTHQLASHGPGKVMSNTSTSLDTLVDKIEAWLDDDAGGMDTSLFKKIIKAADLDEGLRQGGSSLNEIEDIGPGSSKPDRSHLKESLAEFILTVKEWDRIVNNSSQAEPVASAIKALISAVEHAPAKLDSGTVRRIQETIRLRINNNLVAGWSFVENTADYLIEYAGATSGVSISNEVEDVLDAAKTIK